MTKNVSIICMVSLQVQELHFLLKKKKNRQFRENITKFKGKTSEQQVNIKMPRISC